jgi:hypothetical protein
MQLSAEARRCLLTLPASGGVSASTRMVARTCSAALLGSSSSYSYEEERERGKCLLTVRRGAARSFRSKNAEAYVEAGRGGNSPGDKGIAVLCNAWVEPSGLW